MKRLALKFTIIVATVILSLTAAAAEIQKQAGAEWPQWRGPDRNGIAENSPKLLDKWPADGPALAWKYPIFHSTPTDGGMGSPVVASGKVFAFYNFHRRVPVDPEGVHV